MPRLDPFRQVSIEIAIFRYYSNQKWRDIKFNMKFVEHMPKAAWICFIVQYVQFTTWLGQQQCQLVCQDAVARCMARWSQWRTKVIEKRCCPSDSWSRLEQSRTDTLTPQRHCSLYNWTTRLSRLGIFVIVCAWSVPMMANLQLNPQWQNIVHLTSSLTKSIAWAVALAEAWYRMGGWVY